MSSFRKDTARKVIDGPERYDLQVSLFEHDGYHMVTFRLEDGATACGIVAALEMDERVASSSEMRHSWILVLQTSGGARGARIEYNSKTKEGLVWEIDSYHGPCL